MQWMYSVCLHCTYGFVSTVCMQGLCGSSGCTVIMWSVKYNMCSVCELGLGMLCECAQASC